MGKKIVISNVDFSQIKISNIAYKIDFDEMEIEQTKKLYVWFTNEQGNITVTSSNNSILSVGNPTGTGTEFNPYVYTLTAVNGGTVNITITDGTETRTFEQTIKADEEIPANYTRYNAIHVDGNADATVYCDVSDVQLSHNNYIYEFNLRHNTSVEDNMPIFGLRGLYKANGVYDNSRKAFALFINSTTGTPAGAKLGYWWNATDTDQIFNALPMDNNMYTITVSPNNTIDAIFNSTYNDTTINVTATAGLTEWATGFAFFDYRYGNGNHSNTATKNVSIGTTIIRNLNNEIVYKFVPVKNPDNKYGYYETITKKFYGFNEDTQHYDSISGEVD